MKKSAIIVCLVAGGLVGGAAAAEVTITIDNMQAVGGFSFTPVWLAAHNGSFDGFDVGTVSSSDLIALAEGGDTGPISASFASSPAGMAGGVSTTLVQPDAAPVYSPGESASVVLNVGDASVNRYLSFASMIVPSNDLFIGNDDPTAYEMFDMAGNFNGPFEILVFGGDVWDNGSEVNDAAGGAAFSANGGMGAAENGVITRFFDDPNAGSYLLSFVGSNTADGGTIGATFDESTLLARIRVVPAPGMLAGLACGGLLLSRRRR